ncbi:mediator of rna polymerase ii transcription subunit 15a [Olea europaea subsp. europaea]|uniref:Mediator of rna polymerase ii transcription subunit 15a n=1 Tax=Olea europaea subsp. europaea TaxID=158383 RepID=A0A8S0TNR3_OLEEU|nr:mediator of rna polymerase ii transcription subunit 15a [Olea europaea subsp. europaea]
MAARLQQHDSVPLQPKNEQLEKLKFFKAMLECIILFLRIPKNEVQQIHKEKIVGVEKQINNILNLNKPRKSVSSVQQGHLSQPHLHTIQQSQQPQSQMHPHDNQMNLQMQPVNHDSVPLQPKNEQLEKLKFFKAMLERIILFLRIPKNEVQQIHKEKIVGVEKQINNILNLNKPRKSVSSVQQGHLSQPHLHTIQQSQQPQSQMHPHDNQMNLQMQPVNVQGSMAATQQNNTTNLQNNSLSSISGVSNSRQNIMDGLQSGSNMDPASLDSSAQTGNSIGGDWQEEIFQKIRSMNDLYFPELNEMYQKMAARLQQHDSVPLQPKNEQLEKLKFFKAMLERIILFLRIPKNEVQQIHKEKIVGVEKQINNILNLNKPRKSVSSVQQGHLSQPHLHTIQQSQQPQSQMHPHDNQMNLQMQPVNVQGSMAATQQNNTTNLQNNSLSSISGVSNSRQNIMDGLQSGSNMDPGQGNAPNSLQQVAMGSLQQNLVSGPQQHDSVPLQPKNEQLEKLKFFKAMLERIILFLRIPKNEVQQIHKEKIVGVEKQINNILNLNKPRKSVSSVQQGHLSQPHLHTIQQSQQPQSQMHPHDNQMNLQTQPVNVQGSMAATQQNNTTNLQNNSLSSISGVSNSRQNIMDGLQSGSNMDPGQGNAPN